MPIGIGVNGWVWTSPFTNDSLPLLGKVAALGFDAITIHIAAMHWCVKRERGLPAVNWARFAK